MEDRVTAAYKWEIKPNIIIHGIIEHAGENRSKLFELVNAFFKESMCIEETIEFSDAYRLGTGKARPVLVKLKYVSDKAVVYENVTNLKEKRNAKKKLYFVHDDLLEEEAETKKMYQEYIKENLSQDDENKLTIKMSKGRIVVNNNVLKQKVSPPSNGDTLRLSVYELEAIQAF